MNLEQLEKAKKIRKEIDALQTQLGHQEESLRVGLPIITYYHKSNNWTVHLFESKEQIQMLISLAISNTKKEIEKLESEFAKL